MSDGIFRELLDLLKKCVKNPFVLPGLSVLMKTGNNLFWPKMTVFTRKRGQKPLSKPHGMSQNGQNDTSHKDWIGVFGRKTRKMTVFGVFRGF